MNFAYYNHPQEQHRMRVVRYITLSMVLDLERLKLQPEITNALSALVYVDTQHFSSPLHWILLWCLLNKLIRARQIWEQTGCNKKRVHSGIKLRGSSWKGKKWEEWIRQVFFSHSAFLYHHACFRINVKRCTEIKVFDSYCNNRTHTKRGLSVCERERNEIHLCYWKPTLCVVGAELLYSVRRTRHWCTQTAVLPHLIYSI